MRVKVTDKANKGERETKGTIQTFFQMLGAIQFFSYERWILSENFLEFPEQLFCGTTGNNCV